MKPGIRLQLLLLLAALMALAFVPLFFAVASLTQTTLRSVRASSARSLGRSVAAHVSEARIHRNDEGLQPLLDSQIGAVGLEAVGVYSRQGRLVARAGVPHALAFLPHEVPVDVERTRTLATSDGRALEVLVPGTTGPVVAMLRIDDESGRAGPLLRLVALYTGVFALGLLVFTYIVVTRTLVRPIDQLAAAARRVTEGAPTLEVPGEGPREIAQLAVAFAEMTRRLREEEAALRSKIDELERATAELASAQSTIIRAERLASVGRLAAGLAHEIGNPISAILGFEDLLLSGGLEPEEQRDFLERMKRETERINRVLRQLLDFARPAAAPRTQEPEAPGSVADTVRDVAELVRPHKAFREVSLELELTNDLPLVTFPRSQLTQVLLNLLLNAADAAGHHGKVRVRAERAATTVLLMVEDDGPGIRADVREKLFEPFVTTKDVGAGTGLGLAVCRGLIEAAGGTISADDSELGGARFTVELPTAPGSSSES